MKTEERAYNKLVKKLGHNASVRISHHRLCSPVIFDEMGLPHVVGQCVVRLPNGVAKHGPFYIYGNGGHTTLVVKTEGKTFVERAICSHKDPYCKKAGVDIAAERILAKLEA